MPFAHKFFINNITALIVHVKSKLYSYKTNLESPYKTSLMCVIKWRRNFLIEYKSTEKSQFLFLVGTITTRDHHSKFLMRKNSREASSRTCLLWFHSNVKFLLGLETLKKPVEIAISSLHNVYFIVWAKLACMSILVGLYDWLDYYYCSSVTLNWRAWPCQLSEVDTQTSLTSNLIDIIFFLLLFGVFARSNCNGW